MSDFSSNSDDGATSMQVEDDEEYAARRLKEMILDAREGINKIGLNVAADPNIQRGQYHHALAISTKQYIRQVAPLLKRDDLPKAEKYAYNVTLAEGTIPVEAKPLPSKVKRPLGGKYSDGPETWAELAQYADGPRGQLKAKTLLGMESIDELPEPKPYQINGVLDLLHGNTLEATWTVNLGGIGPAGDRIVLHQEMPKPTRAYENAIEAVDTFLNNANLGLSINDGDDDPLSV